MKSFLVAPLLLAACSAGDRTFEIPFRALVGGAPLDCATTYSNIGTTASTLSVLEAKLYIHDPVLVRRDGTRQPLVLEQDEAFQRDRVALLDFDDSRGACAPNDFATHTALRGTAPDEDYTGIAFEVGLPEDLNHLDAATAPAPFNQPGMWWSWKGGYKYIRFDVKTRANPAYYLHMGATSCDGTAEGGYTCASGNVATVALSGFDPEAHAVTFDLARLWSDVDLDHQIDFQSDFVAGCMAFAGDPECPAVFAKLGLEVDGSSNGGQSWFEIGARP